MNKTFMCYIFFLFIVFFVQIVNVDINELLFNKKCYMSVFRVGDYYSSTQKGSDVV